MWQLPEGSDFKHILGISFLAGIGFTMSIFFQIFPLTSQFFINDANLDVLVSSLLAGLIDFIILRDVRRSKKRL
ncbi:Na+/H+ antiporter NhaA [Paenimyroides viscosum]|uniref:Na+/H+ antiporter NhaA n=1 Tax=Paenimyroides viscosum TaxID=2488729 RepID=UPI0037C8EA94